MKILSVGIVCLDIVHVCPQFPKEDEKVRALSETLRRGGNAGTLAAVIGLLGEHEVHLLSTISEGQRTDFCLQDLSRYGVQCEYCVVYPDHNLPTSYVTLSQETGSRTIVHLRDIPELTYEDFQKVPWQEMNWIHFEGRNLSAVESVVRDIERVNKARSEVEQIKVSVELEKCFLREATHNIYCTADLVLVGKDYAVTCGYTTASDAVVGFANCTQERAMVVCAWGEDGACGLDKGMGNEVFHVPAHPPAAVVDTLGAGDTFNGSVVHQLACGRSLLHAVQFACRVAGLKCGIHGYEGLKEAVLQQQPIS